MKRLRMVKTNTITFEEGCNKYLDDCRQRNLREGTIRHYRQSYNQFYKYFDPQMPLAALDEKAYKKYVVYLRETLHNDVSINSYLRDFITTMHYLITKAEKSCFLCGCHTDLIPIGQEKLLCKTCLDKIKNKL